jgi:uroporphyrinogen-III synthase
VDGCATPPLAGWTVAVTAHRRADEQAELLRRRGADVVHAPVVRTLPFDDDRPLRDATEVLLADPPDVLVATTGIGMRGWFGAAEAWGLDDALRQVLVRAEVVARGPKALGALRQIGIEHARAEPSERLDRLVDSLAGIDCARVALQRFGEPVPWAVDALRRAGADVVEVPVYRWVAAGSCDRLLGDIAARRVDAVTFTSAAAARTLLTGAPDAVAALDGDVLAVAVGPVTGEALVALGIESPCAPRTGRLGLLVRALSDEAERRHRHLDLDGADVTIRAGLVIGPGGEAQLAGRERAVFASLAERPGAVVPRAVLLRRVWGGDGDDAAVDTAVARLRRTLAPAGLAVEAVPRRGWRITAPASAPAPVR